MIGRQEAKAPIIYPEITSPAEAKVDHLKKVFGSVIRIGEESSDANAETDFGEEALIGGKDRRDLRLQPFKERRFVIDVRCKSNREGRFHSGITGDNPLRLIGHSSL